jgi:hypothetical protein
MTEQTMLKQLVESADTVEPDWQDALRRAGFVGRHMRGRRDGRLHRALGRRRVLVLVVAAAATFYAVPAVAQERWWWVSSPNESMQPTTQVLTVGRWTGRELTIQPEEGAVPSAPFDAVGEHWLLQAFINKRNLLCVGVSPDPPRLANEGAFIACGHAVHGIGPATTPASRRHWVGFGTAIPGKVDDAKAHLMFGPAAANVQEVDLENEDGRVIRVSTMAAPEGLGVPARFWIAVVPMEQLVHTIVPRDAEGRALEHWRLPIAQ